MFSSMMGGGGNKSSSVRQAAPKVDLHAARKHAITTCKHHHNLVKPLTDSLNSVVTTQWYMYGTMLGTTTVFFAATMAMSRKIPMLTTVGPFVSIATGYVLGGFLHNVHCMKKRQTLVKQLDQSITALEEQDAKQGTNVGIAEYREALAVLNKQRDHELRFGTELFGGYLSAVGVGGGGGDGSRGGAGGEGGVEGMQLVEGQQQQHVDPVEQAVNKIIVDFERRKKARGAM